MKIKNSRTMIYAINNIYLRLNKFRKLISQFKCKQFPLIQKQNNSKLLSTPNQFQFKLLIMPNLLESKLRLLIQNLHLFYIMRKNLNMHKKNSLYKLIKVLGNKILMRTLVMGIQELFKKIQKNIKDLKINIKIKEVE